MRDHPKQQTLMPKVRSGALGAGVRPKHSPSLLAPVGWLQLEGFMADLPQSWHAGTEAQPLISYFELLAQLALLVCHLHSPLPTSGRISLRQSSDNVTAGAAIMKEFTTAHLLRRFVQVFTRWAAIYRVTLEVGFLPGIDNDWADALSRSKDSMKGFFPPAQRINFCLNDLFRLAINRGEFPSTKGGQSSFVSWSAKTCKRWSLTVFDVSTRSTHILALKKHVNGCSTCS